MQNCWRRITAMLRTPTISATAYHEAGHAVMMYRVGFKIDQVSIVPNSERLGRVTPRAGPIGVSVPCFGYDRTRDRYIPLSETQQEAYVDGRIREMQVAVFVAGSAAEDIHTGCFDGMPPYEALGGFSIDDDFGILVRRFGQKYVTRDQTGNFISVDEAFIHLIGKRWKAARRTLARPTIWPAVVAIADALLLDHRERDMEGARASEIISAALNRRR
jgi:hypothetical protein